MDRVNDDRCITSGDQFTADLPIRPVNGTYTIDGLVYNSQLFCNFHQFSLNRTVLSLEARYMIMSSFVPTSTTQIFLMVGP